MEHRENRGVTAHDAEVRRGLPHRLGHAVARRVRPVLLDAEERRFDRSFGIETVGRIEVTDLDVATGERGLGHGYTATSAPLLRWIFRELAVREQDHTFVDMGSGKARAVIAAAERGYRLSVGVEFAAALHEIALRNVARCKASIGPVQLVLGDAAQFPIPAGPLVVYFNNPFTEPVMKQVIDNIAASYEADPRPMVLAYQQLRLDDDPTSNLDLLSTVPFLQPSDRRPRRPYERLLLDVHLLRLFRTTP